MERATSIAGWIGEKPPRGRYTFTHDEVVEAFPEMGAGTLARALTREVSKGRILSPLRGFYVIVPEEYVLRGTVPQSFYIDDMMRYLGRKYYVALLSAAELHGAAHQAPISFFVMIEPPTMRDKKTEMYQTHYFCKSRIPDAYLEQRQTRNGYLNVSGPELTAVDLLTYQRQVGGVTRAATVSSAVHWRLSTRMSSLRSTWHSGAVRHCINYFCSRNRDIRKILILCR